MGLPGISATHHRTSAFLLLQRAILQRVLSASVTVDGQTVSSIQRGLLVLVGLSRSDTMHDCDYIARKLLSLKLFDSADGAGKPWTQSALSLRLDVLLVSQFTLYAELKGNRPDFHTAMPPGDARQLYDRFVAAVRQQYGSDGAERVKDGVFGGDMKVALVNDGPVTLTLDTDDKSWDKERAKDSRPFAGKGQRRQNGQSAPRGVSASESDTTADANSAATPPPEPSEPSAPTAAAATAKSNGSTVAPSSSAAPSAS